MGSDSHDGALTGSALTRRSGTPALASLPVFPHFTPLGLEHLDGIREFTARFDGYSDFNATSLWSWSSSTPRGYLIARLGENLVVEFGDYLSGERFLSFLGDDAVDDAAEEVVDYAVDSQFTPRLQLVPEVTASRLSPSRWLIEADPDSFDYIYDLAQLTTLSGDEFRRVRRRVNRFERLWLPATKVEWLRADDLPGVAVDVLGLFDSWQGRGSEGAASSAPERCALARLLGTAPAAAPRLSDWSALCFVDGTLTAAWLVEATSSSTLCAHFQKVARCEPGRDLDMWINVEQARRGRTSGFRELNAEQDLGVVGLREAKRLLRPVRMLRKYNVTRRAAPGSSDVAGRAPGDVGPGCGYV
jgi:hypothetical protein